MPACYGLWSVRKEALETRCPSGLRMRIEDDGDSDSFFIVMLVVMVVVRMMVMMEEGGS